MLPHWTIIIDKDKVQCVFCNKIVGKYTNGAYNLTEESCLEKSYVSGTELFDSSYQEE